MMKNVIKKYLLIPIAILIGELSFGLISDHLMQSKPYLALKHRIDTYMNEQTILSFNPSKVSYHANGRIGFNIELNQKSHLYLLTLKDNQACLVFPTHQENNIFEKGELTLSSESLRVSTTQTGEQEFVLLASQNALELPYFKATSCIERNEGLSVIKRLEDDGVEVLELDVKVD